MKPTAPSRRDRLRHILADLRMPGALEALDAILHGVDGGALTAPEAIEQLLAAQIQLRNNRRLQAAMRSSRLPVVKQLGDFDFTFQPTVSRRLLEELGTLGFVQTATNVVFLGPPGVGKTHLALALAVRALEGGYSARFTTLRQLAEELETTTWRQQRRRYLSPKLLVIDEVGYLRLTPTQAQLLFDLVTARYEQAPIVLTSNRTFTEWGSLLGDEVLATALLDRLLHHAEVIAMMGNSYRMKDRRLAEGSATAGEAGLNAERSRERGAEM